jgi:hypothetical protein
MEKRYGVLRIIGTIYKVLGAIAAVITVLAVVGMCLASLLGSAAVASLAKESGLPGFVSGFVGAIIFAIGAIIWGGSVAVTLYALGEGVSLLLALEENTRATAMLLRQQGGPRPPQV